MNTPYRIILGSAAETIDFGRKIGTLLDVGMIFELKGDLGAGKTTFVKGLAQGLNVPDSCPVTSPTYTIVNEYPGTFRLFHIDLYRIEFLEELEDIGFDDFSANDHVLAIEWAEKLSSDYFDDTLILDIHTIDDNYRAIDIIGNGQKSSELLQKIRNMDQDFEK